MRVVVQKYVLEDLLDKVWHGDEPHGSVHMRVSDDSLSLLTVNADMLVEVHTEELKECSSGEVVLPLTTFSDIVTNSEEGNITIEAVGDIAKIVSGTTSWNVKLRDAAVRGLEIDGIDWHAVDRSRLYLALYTVRYAAEDSWMQLGLRLLNIESRKITASDSVRMQQAYLGDDFPDLEMLIPIDVVPHLLALLENSKSVQVGVTEDYAIWHIDNTYSIINKPYEQKIDYESVILRCVLSNTDELVVDRPELIKALNRVKACAPTDGSAILWEVAGNTLTLSTKDESGNEAKEELEVIWGKNPKQLILNSTYLMDMLDVSFSKLCHFYLGDSTVTKKSPLMLKDDDGNIGLLQQRFSI
jgi:DNA polymerase III sliding clamp (beta) subunit (PCNA family)